MSIQSLRTIHRTTTLLVVIFILFLGVTGSIIQLIDLRSIYTSAPATDPNVQAMRESFDGPPPYAVRTTADYAAKALPADSALPAMMGTVMHAARVRLGGAPLTYAELRMDGDRSVGQVGVGAGHARFDAATGAVIEQTVHDVPEIQSNQSDRNTFKRLHRMTTFGDRAVYINIVVSIALIVLIVTGIMVYLKLLAQRRKIKRPGLFWSAGGRWRSLHRAISVVCALFIIVVSLSGAWLAFDGLYRSFDVTPENPVPGAPKPAPPPSPFSPLQEGQVPDMLRATLASARAVAPDAPIKVLRLRIYAGYHQGVVVTGGDTSRQLVFNTVTGASMSTTEPGYPRVHFPWGWQAHQWAKSVHRGDMIGLTGRWMDLLTGFAMIYLSVSGVAMYWEMWRKRRSSGRRSLIWK